ncbi:MAG: hypothetical protein JOZ72_19795 [Alphaproteobacteria bacterium]|nr:hypothetical protein [Alphaproteobacteria bacterium]
MRWMLVAALAAGLSGCSDMDFFGDSTASNDVAPAVKATPPAPPPSAAPDVTGTAVQPPGEAAPQVVAHTTAPSAHCASLAKLRARDAAYAGEDEETQQSVYDRTYADCSQWDARHMR